MNNINIITAGDKKYVILCQLRQNSNIEVVKERYWQYEDIHVLSNGKNSFLCTEVFEAEFKDIDDIEEHKNGELTAHENIQTD
jgi:hypothetical protein